ncbi:MAG: peptide chain release factor N(5)-glutamine methyltransferase [Solirubrobacteraceae bacterium MAG38_C4-C5]|nr:peptide chain release factor N(5)-glutamine methyltransferase [Candidatus Siliceabacter maunaloa]
MSVLRGASVRDALDSAVIAITASGSTTPRLDAELLLAHALGVDRTALFLDPEREVGGEAARTFQALARRRSVEHAPVAYLLGRRGFRRLELDVDPRALIPRPETELLVEVGLELPRGAQVVDVGTGSGAVALALKDERPDLDVMGTDVSAEALAVARGNAARLRLEVSFAEGDLLAGLTADAVLANPPYVADGDALPPDIARHEPWVALRAGPDGLDVIRRLVPAAQGGGAALLALEVGAGQAPAVVALAREAGFADVATRADLAGIERVVVARR